MSAGSTHDTQLPEGPDEMLGLTEGGKGWLGVLLALGTLVVLVWTAISYALA
jgi:hypothetical protein